MFQAELLDPALKGTLNVLKSCSKAPSVKRVVLTSSMVAVAFTGQPLTLDVVVDENWFSDPKLCRERNVHILSNLALFSTLLVSCTIFYRSRDNQCEFKSQHCMVNSSLDVIFPVESFWQLTKTCHSISVHLRSYHNAVNLEMAFCFIVSALPPSLFSPNRCGMHSQRL